MGVQLSLVLHQHTQQRTMHTCLFTFRPFEFDYVRGRYNPVVKHESVRNCFSEKSNEHDLYFYDKFQMHKHKMPIEKVDALMQVTDCLIALRDIGDIIYKMIPMYDFSDKCVACTEDYCCGLFDLLRYHCEYLLPEESKKYKDLINIFESQKFFAWADRVEMRKDLLIMIMIDIKINTSVGMFAMKNY